MSTARFAGVIRHEYLVTRAGYRSSGKVLPRGLDIRIPTIDNRLELASLMMDAYLDTIDYEGETEDQAVEEVDGYLAAGAYLDVSRIAVNAGTVESAVLVSRLAGLPIVGYVMTRAALKGRGFASALLDESMAALWQNGHEDVRAFITEGNTPSEVIFTRAGFEVVGRHSD